MRLTRQYIVYMLATLLPMLTACNEDDSSAPLPMQGEEPMEILLYAYTPKAATEVTTRGNYTAFNNFDNQSQMGVSATIGDTVKNNLLFTYTNEGKLTSSSGKIFFPVRKDENTNEAVIAAYYPYQETNNYKYGSQSGCLEEKSDGNIVMFVKSTASTYSNSPYTEAVTDPLFAIDTVERPVYDADLSSSLATAAAELQFGHAMARLLVEIAYPGVSKMTITFKQSLHGEMNIKTGAIEPAFSAVYNEATYETENNTLTGTDDTFIPSKDAIKKITITVGDEVKTAYTDDDNTAIDLTANTVTKIKITQKAEEAPPTRGVADDGWVIYVD